MCYCCATKEISTAGNWTREEAEALCRKVMLTDADLALKSCFNVTQTFTEIHPLEPHYLSNNYELEICITDVLVSFYRAMLVVPCIAIVPCLSVCLSV